MKLGPLVFGKDGGSESSVYGWMLELKNWFSVGILRFDGASRDAFHSHAFNAWSIVLAGGGLHEAPFGGGFSRWHFPSLRVIYTARDTVHKVDSAGVTYVLTFRGPWTKTWLDIVPAVFNPNYWWVDELEHGRGIVESCYLNTTDALDLIDERAA